MKVSISFKQPFLIALFLGNQVFWNYLNQIFTPKGKVFKHNFTAWYTPQLPYKFGPAGYGSLPGLIIELQGDRASYGVKKIEFYDDENKESEMPKLKKKKLISEEEFEGLAAMDEKRWQEKKN